MTEKYETRKELVVESLQKSIDNLQRLLTVLESIEKVDFQTRNSVYKINDKIHHYQCRLVKRLVAKAKKERLLDGSEPIFASREKIQNIIDNAIEKAKQNEHQ